MKKIGLIVAGVSGAVLALDKYIQLPEKIVKVAVWLGGVGVAMSAQDMDW